MLFSLLYNALSLCLCFSACNLGILGVGASPSPLLPRQQALVSVQNGLDGAILVDLANLAKDPLNPGPALQNLTQDFEDQLLVLAQVKPAAGAPDKDDIVDLMVDIIIEVVKGVLNIPITILVSLQLPFLDNSIGKWLQALDNVLPGTSTAAGQSIQEGPDYIHLINLNLNVTLDILGIGNDLEKLGL